MDSYGEIGASNPDAGFKCIPYTHAKTTLWGGANGMAPLVGFGAFGMRDGPFPSRARISQGSCGANPMKRLSQRALLLLFLQHAPHKNYPAFH